MQCNLCNNEATVHLSQIVEGEVHKIDLCENCAKQKGVDDPVGYSLTDFLLGLGSEQQSQQGTQETKKSSSSSHTEVRCPHCGFSQSDFKKSGRLGCPECYEAFGEILESGLKSMHKGSRHVGKVPEAYRQSRDLNEKLKSLKERLDNAVAQEHFEEAAQLRDEINQLKEQNRDLLSESP